MQSILRSVLYPLPVFVFALTCTPAHAIDSVTESGFFNEIIGRFVSEMEGWEPVLLPHATNIFWFLVTVSMVVTFGKLALQRADMQEFVREAMMFILTTGIFWSLLSYGTNIAMDFINSLRQMGGTATGLGPKIDPQTILDVGMQVLMDAKDSFELHHPLVSLVALMVAFFVLCLCALIALNMLILIIASLVMVYAGVIVLGFGGSRWTSEIAINYYKSAIGMGLKLMTMSLIVGIGVSFAQELLEAKAESVTLKEQAVIFVAVLMVWGLSKELPNMVANLVLSANIGSSVGNHGIGTAMAVGGGAAVIGGGTLAAGKGMLTQGAGAVDAVGAAMAARSSGGADTSAPNAQSGPTGGAQQGASQSPLEAASNSGTAKRGPRGSAIATLAKGVGAALKDKKDSAVSHTVGGKIANAIRSGNR